MKIRVNSCEKIENGYAVELSYIEDDSIRLYPDGKGGQLGDRGDINGIKILEVKSDRTILENEIEPGEYEYNISEERREDIRIQHTAEHLLSGITLKNYGINNVGFRMGEEVTTADLDDDNLSDETIEEIEDKLNEAIFKGAKVLELILPIEEAKLEKDLRKPISDKIKDEYISIVKIDGYDCCACAGFHAQDIKDIRVFKIVNYKRHKGKYTRVSFVAGDRALKDYAKKSKIMKTLNQTFSSRDDELIDMIEKLRVKFKELKKEMYMKNNN